jgi:hypothetical protein
MHHKNLKNLKNHETHETHEMMTNMTEKASENRLTVKLGTCCGLKHGQNWKRVKTHFAPLTPVL